jgi:hypothetical protein
MSETLPMVREGDAGWEVYLVCHNRPQSPRVERALLILKSQAVGTEEELLDGFENTWRAKETFHMLPQLEDPKWRECFIEMSRELERWAIGVFQATERDFGATGNLYSRLHRGFDMPEHKDGVHSNNAMLQVIGNNFEDAFDKCENLLRTRQEEDPSVECEPLTAHFREPRSECDNCKIDIYEFSMSFQCFNRSKSKSAKVTISVGVVCLFEPILESFDRSFDSSNRSDIAQASSSATATGESNSTSDLASSLALGCTTAEANHSLATASPLSHFAHPSLRKFLAGLGKKPPPQ